MRNLLDFLKEYHHWFIFILLEVASGFLLFQFNSYQGSAWFSSANAVAGKVYEWESEATKFFTLSQANEELTTRNFYLERQVDQLKRLYADLTKDTTVMERNELQFLSQYKLIPAKVVDNSVHKTENLMTIDKGRADGVEVDMGVACGRGVVGVVYLVSDHYSVVIPVLNATSSRISCAIRNRGYFGYLHCLCRGCAPPREVPARRVDRHQRLLVDLPFRRVSGKNRTGLQLPRRTVV